MSQRVYPSKRDLLKLASAAEALAKALRENWVLDGATLAENYGQAMGLLDELDTRDEATRKRLIRRVAEVAEAEKAFREALPKFHPADALDGMPGEDRLRKTHPRRGATNITVKGWSYRVNEALLALRECRRIFSEALEAKTPTDLIPVRKAEAIESAAKVLRDSAADSKRKRTRISGEEANVRAREALKNTKVKWSERTLGVAIGCSATCVHKLPAWRAYLEDQRKRGLKKTQAPGAVGLTDAMLANEGRPDVELERLIAEHQADFEPSPLISHARKQPRRRRKL